MCLAIPGRIVETSVLPAGVRMGRVRFSDAEREVCLEIVPDADAGDYVIVHTGFAVSVLSEGEATLVSETIEDLEQASVDQE
jgi:hydrogenase expression/formation protein HypC